MTEARDTYINSIETNFNVLLLQMVSQRAGLSVCM
jgi:hypothetical protein